DSLYSAYLEDAFDVADELRLTLGTKLEHNVYTGFEWQPSARVGWSQASHFVWAAVSRTVRTPSAVDRDLALTVATSATLPVFVRVLGNSAFDTERAVVYEGGYRFRRSSALLVELTAFRTRYPNLGSID